MSVRPSSRRRGARAACALSVLLLYFFAFALSMISFACLVSTFFSKAKIAGVRLARSPLVSTVRRASVRAQAR